MKKVEAIIRPFKCDDVKAAIDSLGVSGMTLTEVRGAGQARGEASLFPGAELVLEFLPRLKIEVVVPDDLSEQVVAAIVAAAYSGQVGDGKVFVQTIEQAVRIRTGQTGDAALRQP